MNFFAIAFFVFSLECFLPHFVSKKKQNLYAAARKKKFFVENLGRSTNYWPRLVADKGNLFFPISILKAKIRFRRENPTFLLHSKDRLTLQLSYVTKKINAVSNVNSVKSCCPTINLCCYIFYFKPMSVEGFWSALQECYAA